MLIQICSCFVFPKSVAESERDIENLLRKHAGTLFAPRIKMLIQIKKHSDKINLDGVAFQYFIDEFSKQNENEFKIIVLDNAAFHKVKSLQLLDNIELMFLPPYSSELNLAEKIWWKFKREFSNKLFKNLEKLSDFLSDLANSLTKEDVASISSYNYATNLY